MISRCDACGDVGQVSKFDVFNESGAVSVDVCEDCEERLTTDRCVVCCAPVDDGKRSISAHGTPDDGEPLCAECRRDIVFSDGGVFL